MITKKIKVLMPAAEAAPFAKVGGLADVVGSLPKALKKLDVDIRLVLPLYGCIDRAKYKLKKIYSSLEIPSGMVMIKVDIWEANLPGTAIPVYFIDAPDYFKFKNVYVDNDNSERYLFFSLACIYILPIIKFFPDIIHCQDFHTAMITDIVKTRSYPFLENVKTIYTIHNLNYQGKSEIKALSTGNLNTESLKSLSRDAQNGDINFMAQGILNADLVTTVSPKYAKEINSNMFGAGLEKIIRKRKDNIAGVINGIDTELYNPATDKYIAKNYSIKSLDKKSDNKIILQKELKLTTDKNIPLIGFVSRLVWQKGVDLIDEKVFKLPAQFVFLGTGQKEYENYLLELAEKYPKKVSVNIKFDLKLAQMIYAGADMLLIPSRFEPCGLTQLIAMRYGTVPIVRSTGGLDDTVNSSTGFKFYGYKADELVTIIKKALKMYENKDIWRKYQINSAKQDFSWEKSAQEYIKLYIKIIK
jgi:starch synthase